eukprot:gene16975-18686_t
MASKQALFAVRNIVNTGIFYGNVAFRQLSVSSCSRGLEEFFPPGVLESGGPPDGKDLQNVKTGRRWHASDLRQKSSSDLHKLWYVLLKERNMLQTVKEEARRLQIPMPSPERIKKVQKSMAMIKVVIAERERAIKEIEQQGYKSATLENLHLQANNTEQSYTENEKTAENDVSDKNFKDGRNVNSLGGQEKLSLT